MNKPEPVGWQEEVRRRISASPRPLNFVGVGNTLRRDDGAGIEAVNSLQRALRGTSHPGVKVHSPGAPERTLSKIPRPEGVVIFDAVEAGKTAGRIFCASLDDVKYSFFGTHNVPLRLIPGATGREREISVIGIEPESLEVGEGLTDRVRRSVEMLVAEVVSLVRTTDV